MDLLQLKNSFRYLLKEKGYLLINILGLGTGIAAFLLLFLFVYNDFTYNHFHQNLSAIYRVREGKEILTKGPLLPKMLEQIPEVENGTRIFGWESARLSYGGKAFPENIQYVDTGFFSVFSFPFIEGSSANGIHEKYGAVVSREFAKKYFGDEPATGKKLQVRFDGMFLQVNGVVDIPANSSIRFDLVTSYETGQEISPWLADIHDWYNTFSNTYVLLRKGTNPESIDAKLQQIVHENFIPVGENKTDLNLLPFKDYHAAVESNRTLIVILAVIAFGIIGIAVVNFVNLTITSLLTRTREIGLKKLMGVSRFHLFTQMMTETLMISLLALLAGCLLAWLILPVYNQLLHTALSFDLTENKWLVPMCLLIWVMIALLSGLIPSLFLARTSLSQNLKGELFVSKSANLRYSLVVVQFIIAIVLISGSLLIRKQISDMISKDPMFDRENVIVAQLDTWQYADPEAASRKFRIISEELKRNPYVEAVSFSQAIPGTYQENYNTFYPEGGSAIDQLSLRKSYVGRDYFKTYGIPFQSGSGFDDDQTNYGNKVVLNRAAMRELGFSETAGQVIREGSKTGTVYEVIGEIKDFSYQGVQREVQPLAHFCVEREKLSDWDYLSVRAKAGATSRVVELIRKEWEQTAPSLPVTWFFAEDKLNEQYAEYEQVNKLIALFSVVAIILSCMGLFALSSYMMTRRTKEIGIRKVNGATVVEVIVMLNRHFVKWIVVAFMIAAPLSWYALHQWLGSFAYKTELSWWIFALAGLLDLGIALLTVSWQSWKAATRNPVEALRYE